MSTEFFMFLFPVVGTMALLTLLWGPSVWAMCWRTLKKLG